MSKTEQTEAPAEDAESIPMQNRVEAGMEGADADGDDATSSLQADLDRFRDMALRAQADFDNFELGLSAARAEGEKSPIYAGMSMVLKKLNDLLGDNGLQPIDAEGQKFDPNLHEAIAHEPSADVGEGIVIRQTRRGYRLKDRLLRPSSVVVSSGPAK